MGYYLQIILWVKNFLWTMHRENYIMIYIKTDISDIIHQILKSVWYYI
jgi:hypothetical protein